MGYEDGLKQCKLSLTCEQNDRIWSLEVLDDVAGRDWRSRRLISNTFMCGFTAEYRLTRSKETERKRGNEEGVSEWGEQ